MSTVKPLNIYIGETKVFPDVNLSGIEMSQNPAYADMYEDTEVLNDDFHMANFASLNDWKQQHSFEFNMPKALIMPVIEDTNDSPWHTNSDPGQNYWQISNDGILAIPFTINQNWVGDYFVAGNGLFAYSKMTVINFDAYTSMPNTVAYNQNDHSIKTVDILCCRNMFHECTELREIHGLNLGGTRNHMQTYQNEDYAYSAKSNSDFWVNPFHINGTYRSMFESCWNLNTLDITWPEAASGTNYPILYTNDASNMFHSCHNLPENQIPTFAFRPVNQGDLIDISNLFGGGDGGNAYISSMHMTDDSWPYIKYAHYAWANPRQVTTIDIPATATELISIGGILGDNLPDNYNDWSAYQYIIRTTAPMTAKLNSVEGADCRLFNFWDYEGNSDFQNTFGGIYVPDSQVNDYKNMIGSEYSCSNIAANHVHGLSDL